MTRYFGHFRGFVHRRIKQTVHLLRRVTGALVVRRVKFSASPYVLQHNYVTTEIVALHAQEQGATELAMGGAARRSGSSRPSSSSLER